MANELASQPSGSQSECPYKGIRHLRHITTEELVLRILGGSAIKFWDDDESWAGMAGFPEYYIETPGGGGEYICTCGGDYQYHE